MKQDVEFEKAVAYISGRFEAQIEGFASNLGVSPQLLAERVAGIIHSGGTGHKNRMPLLRNTPTQRSEKLGKTLEVDERSHSAKTRSGVGQWWNGLSKKRKAEIIAKRVAGQKKWRAAQNENV